VRKLARHGVRSRTTEEQIIYLIIEALKRSRIKSMSDAFEVIDKEGRGTISRDDFRDIFKSLNVKIAE
jgi:Ca2+-binding EF-hand superfamily protein